MPRTHKQYPELLPEMCAYTIAVAHLDLPRQQMKLMVSDTKIGEDESRGEIWDLVRYIEDDKIFSQIFD